MVVISKLEKLSESTNSGVEELFADATDLMEKVAQAGTAVEKVELEYLVELVEI